MWFIIYTSCHIGNSARLSNEIVGCTATHNADLRVMDGFLEIN